MKKDQTLPNKNIHSNYSSGKPLPINSNYSRQQSLYNTIEDDHHTKEILKIFHKTDIVDHIVEIVNTKITAQEQIQIKPKFRQMTDPIQILEIEIIQIIGLENFHTTDMEIILMIGIETAQTIKIPDTK